MDSQRDPRPPIPTSPAGRPMINAGAEMARLRELESLGIALEQPDQSLQEVVDRVAQIYGVGLCTVNLILGDRQVFKAWAGDLPEEMAAMRWIDRQKGLCTYVVASHTPLVIDDMAASDEWRDQYFCAAHGVRFYAGVPLVTSHGHALGTLCLADGNPRSLSDSELERLQLFSKRVAAELQLSGAMERTRSLQAELETTARYSTILAELSVQLDEAVEAGQESVAQVALKALLETAGLAWGAVVISQDGSAWTPCAAGTLPTEIQRLAPEGSRRDEYLLSLLNEGTRPFDPAWPAALAVVPMAALAPVTPAVLVAALPADRREWSGQDQRFLETGARLLGAALRRLQRWRDLQTATLTDELTRLRNRRALEQLAADPGTLGDSFTVWVGDLHGFKILNDSLGHSVGDLCLRQVAEALLSQLRPADARFLFRLGGDEFVLALPLPQGGHPDLGRRLQAAVARLAAASYPGVDLHLDLGEAAAPGEAATLTEALKLADARMYEAKRARRAEP
jgi:diguanylate cyclase (GGDEF)-like protein